MNFETLFWVCAGMRGRYANGMRRRCPRGIRDHCFLGIRGHFSYDFDLLFLKSPYGNWKIRTLKNEISSANLKVFEKFDVLKVA